MSKPNIELIEECIEVVLNQKRFDRVFEFYSHNAVLHTPPYVGLGITADDRSGHKVFLREVAPSGPAYEKLLPGDELIRVQDHDRAWETFDELRNGLWGQGVLGTPITVTVRRENQQFEIPLVRGRVNGWDIHLNRVVDVWEAEIKNHWPDMRVEIKLILGQGDLVSCYLLNSGTNTEFHHTAIWSELDIFRIQNHRITETWGVEDTNAELKQLGFRTTEPVKELA